MQYRRVCPPAAQQFGLQLCLAAGSMLRRLPCSLGAKATRVFEISKINIHTTVVIILCKWRKTKAGLNFKFKYYANFWDNDNNNNPIYIMLTIIYWWWDRVPMSWYAVVQRIGNEGLGKISRPSHRNTLNGHNRHRRCCGRNGDRFHLVSWLVKERGVQPEGRTALILATLKQLYALHQ